MTDKSQPAKVKVAEKPQWIKPRISAAPKVRQVYWCDFPNDAQLPEMWKTRPVIVMSFRNKLYGPCTVIPVSTDPDNEKDPWAYKLPEIEGCEQQSWAVCNQVTTVAPSRLSQVRGKIPMVPQEHFNEVHALLLKWLPALRVEKS